MRDKTGLTALCLSGLLLLTGCPEQEVSPTGSSEVNRLREELSQEQARVREVRDQVEALRTERKELMGKLEARERELTVLRGGKRGEFRFEPTEVTFGFLSAAVDWDGKGGDDGIQALVCIEDQTGGSIKRAGEFRFELYDLANSKEKAIEKWTFTAEAAAEYWRSVGSGYLFKLPFTAGTPKGKQVTLVVEVTLSEGVKLHGSRQFRIDH